MKNKNRFLNMNNIVYVSVFVTAVLNVFLFLDKSTYLYYGLGLSGALIVYSLIMTIIKNNNWKFYIDKIDKALNSTKKTLVLNVPVPVIVTDRQGTIIWYNSKLKKYIKSKEEIIDQKIQDIYTNWDWESIIKGKAQFFRHNFNASEFEVIYTFDESASIDIMTFYFIDVSSKIMMEKLYKDQQPVIAYIQVDNYDEIISTAKENRAPFIISEIENIIKEWVDSVNGVINRLGDDKFVVYLQKKMLKTFKTTKFNVLDKIREIDTGNTYPITLSIGVSGYGNNLKDIESYSLQAIELALGRGGDQAVVKGKEKYDYYGGRSKNVERNSRVKSRVVAQALVALIRESDNIYIMGHRYPDLDAIGSAIGMYRMALNLGKKAYIVLNEFEDQISELTKEFKGDDLYSFVSSDYVKQNVTKEDILVVVDVHRPNLVEDPDLIELFDKLVVIDHHRRSADAFEDTSLFYLEPYASSASELVAELLQYSTDNIKLLPKEANALLSGIVLDTKGFTVATGVRTFDAASFLRRKGADTKHVKSYFKDNFEDSILRGNIISSTQLYKKGLAISVSDKKDINIKKIISQSADSIISIKGINTAFVIGENMEGVVFVSARSDGEVNVQVILEAIGGGGHITGAGAQITDMTIREVEELVKTTIDKYLKEA